MNSHRVCQISLFTAILGHLAKEQGVERLPSSQLNVIISCCDRIVEELGREEGSDNKD